MIISFILIALFGILFPEVIFMMEKGTPPKDKDVLEMLNKYKDTYSISKNWQDQFYLDNDVDWKSSSPKIVKLNYSILWFGYIEGVGLLPRWYKSSKILKQIFNEKIKASRYSRYYQTKRDKLGL